MFDNALLKQIKNNPDKGMSALINQYTGLVYTIVSNKISAFCSKEDIEEVVSDVFVSFYYKVNNIDLSKGTIAAYISCIAKRKATDKLRSCSKPYEISIDDENTIEIPDSYDIELEAQRKALYSDLIEKIKELGEPDTTIIFRRYFLGESTKEIAEYLGISDDNIRKRLSRGLQKLQKNMKGYYYED